MKCLLDGTSVRATERITGVHRDTIIRLMVRMGEGCSILLDEAMRGLNCKRLQVDEIWSFVHTKQRKVKRREKYYGDVWVFVALDPDSKLVPLHKAGKRDRKLATDFLIDLKGRLRNRVQLSTDALKVYVEAAEDAFGGDVDYGQVVKTFETDEAKSKYVPVIAGEEEIKRHSIYGKPDPRHISTSLIERQNLTMRMCMRRFTRRTNGFSKKVENHRAAIALHFAYYNFTRIHQTLNITPAVAAGVLSRMWSLRDLMDEAEQANERQGAGGPNPIG